jgi:hypothetical protein
MKFHQMKTLDKAAVLLSTGLMFVGIVVLGLIETFDGRAHVAATVEQTNQAGEVVATYTPTIAANIRVGFVVAGIGVLLVYGLYKLLLPEPAAEETPTAADTPT